MKIWRKSAGVLIGVGSLIVLLGLTGCLNASDPTGIVPVPAPPFPPPLEISGQEMYNLLSQAFPEAKIMVTHTKFLVYSLEEVTNFLSQDQTDQLSFPCPQMRKVIAFVANGYEYFNWEMVAIGWAVVKRAPGWVGIVVVKENCQPQIYGINPANDGVWPIHQDPNVEEVAI